MADRNIQRDRKGGYKLRLPPYERELLRSLPAQFREVLQTDDPSAPALALDGYLSWLQEQAVEALSSSL